MVLLPQAVLILVLLRLCESHGYMFVCAYTRTCLCACAHLYGMCVHMSIHVTWVGLEYRDLTCLCDISRGPSHLSDWSP